MCFSLVHQKLNAHHCVGNDQKNNGKIDCNVTGRNHIEKLSSHILQITFIVQTGFIEFLIHFRYRLHQADTIRHTLIQSSIHINIEISLGVIGKCFVRQDQRKRQRNGTVCHKADRLHTSG